LHAALSAAAGVAGGALMFQGIERLLGYNMSPFGSPFGYGAGFGGSPWGANVGGATPAENVTVNNYYDTPPDAGANGPHLTDGNLADNGPAVQDADYSDNGGDFSGGDWT
jgi:hypothetical protein